jgi:hypothetical protein
MPALFWALFGLVIWFGFGFGFAGMRSVRDVAVFDARRNGGRLWNNVTEWWARWGILCGALIWLISKGCQSTCKGYGTIEFRSWFGGGRE